ncbi:PREDICTED: ankyrin, partial [Prunus dulcis]
AVAADAAVVEVLDSSNYVDWGVLVKNYLLAQDLWDVLEEDEEEDEDEEEEETEEEADDKFRAWKKKKNATALHKIQISCGREAFSLIRNATSAKSAWDTLAEKFKPKPFLPRYDQRLYKPLFDAVWFGDWNEAKEFLNLHPDAIRARLPSTNKTALYMATELEHENIVEELVQLMSEEDLEITDHDGWTALALAASRGNIKMVECMVRKSKKILSIANNRNLTPIPLASGNDQWDVVRYLYSVTPIEDLMPEKGPFGAGLIYYFITRRKFGMARELIRCCPRLVLTKDHYGLFPIEAFRPSAFPSGTRLKFWQQKIYDTLELLDNMCEVIKPSDGIDFLLPAVFRATELGMFEFIDRVLQARPNVMWASNPMRRNLFQFAIECRQEKVYNLFYYKLSKRQRTVIGNIVDRDNNCALHVAGMLSPFARLDNISGAALKMQRELQWFKEVENIVVPVIKESLNKEHKMPREMFTKNHNQLVKQGERWMKETASSCTVVGALIITIMFAAAFTIPGGNNGQTGFPIFLHK